MTDPINAKGPRGLATTSQPVGAIAYIQQTVVLPVESTASEGGRAATNFTGLTGINQEMEQLSRDFVADIEMYSRHLI